MVFVSPGVNMTYYQYTGDPGDPGDSAMMQLTRARDTEKLSLYAFIREIIVIALRYLNYLKLPSYWFLFIIKVQALNPISVKLK